ncbi:hypothetical protein LCGC14_0576560 [marine sediment metagenome]|uniref:Uncharacterized protein n=1 Tax=marine sediment metagenome TaxID=412755 RepID=A0A0F9S180_9ZZZZ|nr:MAG: hypothetical protein Lokiarch_01960 [Candidatus Lokiarchaeum sp. GC14_75]
MSCCGGNSGSVNVNMYREKTIKTSKFGKSGQKEESKMVSKQLREK